jgi:hypothetical protein
LVGRRSLELPDPLIKSRSQRGPEPNIDKKAQPLRSPLALFLRQWKVYVLPRFRHKTSTEEYTGSALALQATLPNVNIAKG